MKTTQTISNAAWLFSLTTLATSTTSTTLNTAAGTATGEAASTSTNTGTYAPPIYQWESLGCFKVASTKENPLSSSEEGVVAQPSFNTRDACASGYCASYKYAAVGDGDDCYCADELDAALTAAADDECDVPCPGFAEQNCGGAGFLQIYENHDASPSGRQTTLSVTESSSVTSSAPTGSASKSSSSEVSSSRSAAPSASESVVPSAANSNPMARSWAWVVAGAGVVFFL